MFHAIIHSDSHEPLTLSGEASPYNLQLLREHVLRGRPGTRVEVRMPSALQPAFLRLVQELERRGVELVFAP